MRKTSRTNKNRKISKHRKNSKKTNSVKSRSLGAWKGASKSITATKWKSPYATTFISGINGGKSCFTVATGIAQRTGKPLNTIFQSLFNAGLCFRAKFNNNWIYWPTFAAKTSAASVNTAQSTMWQSFVDWCVTSGRCTPRQLNNNSTSQKTFMTFCRNFFSTQFGSTTGAAAWWTSATKNTKSKTSTKNIRKSSTRKPKKSSKRSSTVKWPTGWTTSAHRSWKSGTYKFPSSASRHGVSRRRAA